MTERESRADCVVLGVDTSLRSTGWAVVEARGHACSLRDAGTIRIPSGRPVSAALKRIGEEMDRIVGEHGLTAAAIEGVYYCRNVRTALTLGLARGVVIAACARAGVPIYEYAPRRVKQSATGNGAATKDQVGAMVRRVLALDASPREDEADAMALALAHWHGRTGIRELQPDAL